MEGVEVERTIDQLHEVGSEMLTILRLYRAGKLKPEQVRVVDSMRRKLNRLVDALLAGLDASAPTDAPP